MANKHRAINNATTWALSVFESDLTPTQKLICLYLRTHMNDYRDVAWPSVARIAAKCSVTERTVYREMPKICEAGFLMRNGSSNSGTIRYEIATPALDAPPDTMSPLTSCRNTPDTMSPELTKELTNTLSKGKRMAIPSLDDVRAYCQERGNQVDPETFHDWNTSKGWKVGNQPMKDWKAAVRTWEKREKQNGKDRSKTNQATRQTSIAHDLTDTSWAN